MSSSSSSCTAPSHFIAGGGFFAHFTRLPVSLAWDAFGAANGAESFAEMRRRVERYRRIAPQRHEDYTIGCILLQQPFFFEREAWIPVPPDFHRNIVQGKTYDTSMVTGRALLEAVEDRLREQAAVGVGEEPAVSFIDTVVARRLGQGTFRVLVTDVYGRRCAATGERALPVLDAAHIRPVAEGGIHDVRNGLCLRTDLHRLFDRGYLTVTPKYTIRVSRRLRDDFDNGEPYYPLEGQQIALPPDELARPDREALEWHGDVLFRG